MLFEGTGEWGGSGGDWCVVARANMEVGVVPEEEWPFGGVNFGCATVR